MAKDNIIFGINAVQQLLDSDPDRILEIYIAGKNPRLGALISGARQQGIALHNVDSKKLDQYGSKHQGVVAKITATKLLGEADLKILAQNARNPLFLILDGVQDPHNLGACLRTADGAGVTAIIIPKDNASGITPTVRKVASGAAESVPIVQVTNLARAMRELQELGVWIVGTADNSQDLLYDLDLHGALALVMGSEDQGLRALTRKHCDFLAKIPMHGAVGSLNVSVATGICLYEIVRQRLQPKP